MNICDIIDTIDTIDIIDSINSIDSIDSIAAFKLNKNIYHIVDRDSGDSRNYRDRRLQRQKELQALQVQRHHSHSTPRYRLHLPPVPGLWDGTPPHKKNPSPPEEQQFQRKGRTSREKRRRPTLPHCGAVPSARPGLTSLFGMGRGGAPAL